MAYLHDEGPGWLICTFYPPKRVANPPTSKGGSIANDTIQGGRGLIGIYPYI